MNLIELKDICKVYSLGKGEIKIDGLKDINLTISEGEFVAVMGHSGSGKSTLMNILGCLDRPTSGEYRLDGKPINRMKPNELAEIRNRTIGFVFQSYNLLPSLDSIANVEMPMVYSGLGAAKRRELAKEALTIVGLSNRMKHRPTQLSGGQQQKVAIARAIVEKPRVLLADEPTGNLDTASSKEIMGLLTSLNKSGITMVIVTHEPEVAAFASRVLTFKDGRCISDSDNVEGGGDL